MISIKKGKTNMKRIFPILLCLVLLLGSIPVTVFASNNNVSTQWNEPSPEDEVFTCSRPETIQAVEGWSGQSTSLWYNNYVEFYDFSSQAIHPIEIQLKELVTGEVAAAIAKRESKLNIESTCLPDNQWIFMKFHIKNCGTQKLDVSDRILTNFCFYTSMGIPYPQTTAILEGDLKPYNHHDVDLLPGASSNVWIGLYIGTYLYGSRNFLMLRITCKNSPDDSFWLDTNPFHPSLQIHNHNFVETSSKPATCTSAGSTVLTCDCGETTTETLEPLGHMFVNNLCSRCGSKFPFTDVTQTDWYYNAVGFAVNNSLFNGTSSTTFSPNVTMTRGMLVTVLWRSAGQPETGFSSFSDVPANAYYAKAVAWANSNNVVNGVGNNRFNPDGTITREQMATILFRYTRENGLSTDLRANLTTFPDGSSTSSYAKDALSWAVAIGLIQGSNGKLMPQSGATRAQVATILMRYFNTVSPLG